MTLFAQRRGEGSAALVLLHGFGGSHAVWRRMLEHLGHAPHVIAYDLPGYGGSADFPDAGPPKRAASAILQDLRESGVERAHLVGHSMGGAVAAICALLEPQRVAGLTLLAPGGFGPEINRRLLMRFAAAESADAVLACLESMFGYLAPVPDGAVTAALEARAQPGRRDLLQRMGADLVRDGRQGMLPLDTIAGLGIATSVVWGGLDNVLPARQLESMPGGFSAHRFADLGHMLPEEAPDAMARIVMQDAAASIG